MVIQAYKNIGETPLDVIKRLKNENSEYKHIPMTYAGRLDPTAEGLMLVLAGDDCIKKDEYTNLPKEYEVTVLFGFATDTYDLLGLVESSLEMLLQRTHKFSAENLLHVRAVALSSSSETTFIRELESKLQNFIGKIDQKYPPYSSRTVNGKPLWEWAREGRLDEITIPSHQVNISKIEVINKLEIKKNKLSKYIKDNIVKIKGDFRQEIILEKWKEVLENSIQEKFICIKLKIECSSGTYVRVIAHELGEQLGIPALAMHIKRTKIGNYKI